MISQAGSFAGSDPIAHGQFLNGSSPRVRLISVRVEDRAGVLQRITNCLARRGLHLASCAVGQGSESGVLNLWLRVDPGTQPADQIVKQLNKLIDVVSVEDLTRSEPIEWAMALVEFRPNGRGDQIEETLRRVRAEVVHRDPERLIAALAGPPDLVQAMLDELSQLPIVDFVCSRPMALGSGYPVSACEPARHAQAGSE